MIYATRRFIRLFGWLLTPFAAWAVSFLGGWLGALVGRRLASPRAAVAALVIGAVAGAFAGAGLWIWGLRRAWMSALRHRRERLMQERALRRTQGSETFTPSDSGGEG